MKFKHTIPGDERQIFWKYEDEAKATLKYFKDGDIVFDIGANIFDHSIYFALHKPKIKIFSFEPVKEYFEYGVSNLKDHGVNNVMPFNLAIGDTNETRNILISNESSSLIREGSENGETINIRTIDSLIADNKIPKPNFVKIDVEGYALFALKGMLKTIESSKPTILLEIHPKYAGIPESIEKVKFLFEKGYKVVEFINDYEYVFIYGDNGIEFDEFIKNKRIRKILIKGARSRYDKAKTSKERKEYSIQYKQYSYLTRNPANYLIWSRLFVFFSRTPR